METEPKKRAKRTSQPAEQTETDRATLTAIHDFIMQRPRVPCEALLPLVRAALGIPETDPAPVAHADWLYYGAKQ